MNPLTNVRNLAKLNDRELKLGIAGDSSKSWHQKYKDSAWIFIGGIPFDLTEGDVIAVFSQYGEIVNLNLVRDRKTGKSRGFGFLCYEDQQSTILAVDNFNGIKLLGRTIRVDHVEEYRVPKVRGDEDSETLALWMEGCAPKPPDEQKEEDLLLPLPDLPDIGKVKKLKHKKEKKTKKEKKDKKKKDKRHTKDKGKLIPETSSTNRLEDFVALHNDDFANKDSELLLREGVSNDRLPSRDREHEKNRKRIHDFDEKRIHKLDRYGSREVSNFTAEKKKACGDNAYVPQRYK